MKLKDVKSEALKCAFNDFERIERELPVISGDLAGEFKRFMQRLGDFNPNRAYSEKGCTFNVIEYIAEACCNMNIDYRISVIDEDINKILIKNKGVYND